MSDQPRPRLLNFITGNANKLAEVRAILSAVPGLELQSRNVEGVEIQGSIEEVARDKCSRAARAVRSSLSPLLLALSFSV
jgi:inosine triphosphate pyrophosphatase